MVRICRRLDGLPLALELAAARTNVLTVRELADTLDSELGILQTSGPGGDHELVDAMVSWSYQLLSPREKLIFERLSVFASAFGRDAVAEICGDELGEVEVVDVCPTWCRSRSSPGETTASPCPVPAAASDQAVRPRSFRGTSGRRDDP